MLVASALLLNHSDSPQCFQICPWLHSDSNNLSDGDQMRVASLHISPFSFSSRGNTFCNPVGTKLAYLSDQIQEIRVWCLQHDPQANPPLIVSRICCFCFSAIVIFTKISGPGDHCRQFQTCCHTCLFQVRVPDILPSYEGGTGALCMTAGDFGEVYSAAEQIGKFDAVVTCFFLDCAHNIFHFIDVIHQVLKVSPCW